MVRRYLGIAGQSVPLDPRLVHQWGLRRSTGVLISAVAPRSPAMEGGLQRDDVLVELAGQPVPGVDAIHRLLTREVIGQEMTAKVLRDGGLLEIRLQPVDSQPRF